MLPESPFLALHIEMSWQKALKETLAKPDILQLACLVEKEYALSPIPIYPSKDLIFNALNMTPYPDVKVVIVGQDPYHGPGQAHGLAFSVPETLSLPPSLKNIFKEIQADLGIPYPPPHGCLSSWAKQGVLLLNATLTVQQGKPLSHHGVGWEKLTDEILHKLSERDDPVIFVLWGKSAQEKCRFLRQKIPEEYIFTAPHPSPFSAHSGFFGCRHFSQVNAILKKQNKMPIDWQIK
jgi:uracil-DNA glycosylase